MGRSSSFYRLQAAQRHRAAAVSVPSGSVVTTYEAVTQQAPPASTPPPSSTPSKSSKSKSSKSSKS